MARTRDEKLAQARKTEILDAAAHCFVAYGIHQASMRQICKQSGLSAGAVYNYFESKDAIIEGLAKRDSDEIEQLSEYLDNAKNHLKAIIQAAKWIVSETSKSEAKLQVELLSEASRNNTVRHCLETNDNALFECFSAAVDIGQKKGSISKMLNPKTLTKIIVATYEGFLGRLASDPNSDRKEMVKLVEHMLTQLLKP